MIFNCVENHLSLYIKKNKFTFHFLYYLLLFLKFDRYSILYPFFFYPPHFLTFYFFVNTEIGLKFRTLSSIECYS